MGAGDNWPGISGGMADGVHVLPVRVYYEDTDFSGRVYHASYLRFCERGRTELLRASGLSHSALMGDDGGYYFAVRRMVVDYMAPATIDDLLEVRSAFTAMSGARLTIAQRIRRGDTAILEADVTVAVLGAGGRPRRLPARLAGRLVTAPAAGFSEEVAQNAS